MKSAILTTMIATMFVLSPLVSLAGETFKYVNEDVDPIAKEIEKTDSAELEDSKKDEKAEATVHPAEDPLENWKDEEVDAFKANLSGKEEGELKKQMQLKKRILEETSAPPVIKSRGISSAKK